MLPHRSTTPKIASLLPRCERLMLAPRRAKKRVSALGCMRLRSDVAAWQQLVSSPSGKAKNFFPPAPQGQRTLLQSGCVGELFLVSSAEPLSLRRTPSHICLPLPLGKQERSEYCEARPILSQRGNLAEAPILTTRVLSSRSPRHLTCTSTWLLFQ